MNREPRRVIMAERRLWQVVHVNRDGGVVAESWLGWSAPDEPKKGFAPNTPRQITAHPTALYRGISRPLGVCRTFGRGKIVAGWVESPGAVVAGDCVRLDVDRRSSDPSKADALEGDSAVWWVQAVTGGALILRHHIERVTMTAGAGRVVCRFVQTEGPSVSHIMAGAGFGDVVPDVRSLDRMWEQHAAGLSDYAIRARESTEKKGREFKATEEQTAFIDGGAAER
jgi:hypothetical protein